MWGRRGARRGGRGGTDPTEEQRHAVELVLRSRSWHEVLGLAFVQQEQGQDGAAPASNEGPDIESGLAAGDDPENTSDEDVMRAFIDRAVDVHPFRNPHADALLALRWTVDSLEHLRGRTQRAEALVDARQAQEPVRQQECGTDGDEALRLFAETVTSAVDGLSLLDVERTGVGKPHADALLHGLHILQLRGPRGGGRSSADDPMLGSVLAGALMANWLLASMARLLSRPSRRAYSEWACSTIVAAVGAVALSGASRLQRVLTGEGGQPLAAAAEAPGPCVQCPLCRTASPTGRAIKNVHVGEAAPACCVCTEARSDVCLPCGHICLCQHCFGMLPRLPVA